MQIGVKEHLHTYSSCFPSPGLNFEAITNEGGEKKQQHAMVSAIISSSDEVSGVILL